jgi:2-oxo-4-hydroxy-4-carboxy-5-ureidoimidazoline decarboxylase
VSLADFNAASHDAARDALAMCCVSSNWIAGMLAGRPFASPGALVDHADAVWHSLGPTDYLEAFEGHPKIGDIRSLHAKYAHTGDLAAGEQAGVAQADEDLIQRLAEGNRAYEERFGFIFIVCASGKSAGEMCAMLEERLQNSRDDELQIAAEEQRKILQLRLEKLL